MQAWRSVRWRGGGREIEREREVGLPCHGRVSGCDGLARAGVASGASDASGASGGNGGIAAGLG